jgi:glycosyltransferase involved in cell wall biosynthesis
MSGQSQASLRILQVFNRYLQPGGEEDSVERIATHLKLAGFEVTDFWRASEEWTRPDAPPKWQQLFLTMNNPAVLHELRELHLRTKPDVWVLHNVVPVISLGVYRLARELGVPVIQWLHNYRPISPSGLLRAGGRMLQPDDPWLVAKEILAGSWRGPSLTAWLALGFSQVKSRGDFDAVKAWIAISSDMRNIFERADFPKEKLYLLRHAWDIPPPRPAGVDAGYFLFLGRMVEEKGVRFLMELWQRPEFKNIELVMAGQGPLVEEYRGRTPSNVRWAGFVAGEEKRRLIARARAVLFPCLWNEPLGLVVYEAFGEGRPVIGSDLGGLKDLITDGVTGRLLPPADIAVWTSAIQQLAREPELSHKMGRCGFEWLKANVSPSAWAAQFKQILEKVLR